MRADSAAAFEAGSAAGTAVVDSGRAAVVGRRLRRDMNRHPLTVDRTIGVEGGVTAYKLSA
jgi:hypothetical protein